MKRNRIAGPSVTAFALGAVLWGSNARAQEAPYLRQSLPAPSKAFELQIGSGYTQGFGHVLPNTGIPSVAGAGIGFTADLGYRVNPRWSIELEGQYQQYAAENSSSSNGFNTNVGATFHVTPHLRGDPWLRLGAGWRTVWQHNATGPYGFASSDRTNAYHGWQVATVRFGYDIRTSRDASWAPFVGADLQAFFWQNGNQLPSSQWGTFLYIGLQGRFDFEGTSSRMAAR